MGEELCGTPAICAVAWTHRLPPVGNLARHVAFRICRFIRVWENRGRCKNGPDSGPTPRLDVEGPEVVLWVLYPSRRLMSLLLSIPEPPKEAFLV
jgi:hypothetical protein